MFFTKHHAPTAVILEFYKTNQFWLKLVFTSYFLNSNLFFFGHTIDVLLIRINDYLRCCMELNMACEKYMPIKF